VFLKKVGRMNSGRFYLPSMTMCKRLLLESPQNLLVMNWKFIKSNWFALAFGILLVCYAMRKYPQWNPFTRPDSPRKETKSEEHSAAKKGAALLGFVPDDSDKKMPEQDDLSEKDAELFLKRFAHVALSEKKKFGIPVSIILASAYVNSKAGKSEAAKKAHNYFALPCAEDWEAETITVSGQCMREYESAWASFRDFSIFLSSQEWFGAMKKSAGKNWRKWAEKLGEEDISETARMVKLIEEFDLQELD
jgi:hypothetical protein